MGGGISKGGPGTNTIRICPRLDITEGQVRVAIDILNAVLPEI